MERNLIRERTKSALAVKRTYGQRTGSVPFGFDLDDDGTTLIPNPSEQQTSQDIQSMRDNGLSFPKIAEALTSRGILTKQGNGLWNQATIRSILKRKAIIEEGTRR